MSMGKVEWEIHENHYLYFHKKISLFLEQILSTLHWKLKSSFPYVLIHSMLHFTSGKLEKLICRTLLAFLASQSTNLAITCYATTFSVISRRGTTYLLTILGRLKTKTILTLAPSETFKRIFFFMNITKDVRFLQIVCLFNCGSKPFENDCNE